LGNANFDPAPQNRNPRLGCQKFATAADDDRETTPYTEFGENSFTEDFWTNG